MNIKASISQTLRSADIQRLAIVAILALEVTVALIAAVTSTTNDQVVTDTDVASAQAVQPVGSGIPAGGSFDTVTVITNAGDDRLFVGQRTGEIYTLYPDGHQEMFLDLSNVVWTDGAEFGLYDIAFHPDFAQNGLFYVSYTSLIDPHIYVVLNRFHLENGATTVDPSSAATLIQNYQKTEIHKGGGLDFDDRNNQLYMGLGDDAEGWLAQDADMPNGKVIRLTVDDIPADVTGDVQDQFAKETWAVGVRNPWRIDVDETSGLLYIADVNEDNWEEVNAAPIDTDGTNFGWPCRQGPYDYDIGVEVPACQDNQLFTDPLFAFSHDDGRCAIIGGSVYRPADNPSDGRFIFSDLCTRDLFALATDSASADPGRSLGVISDSALLTLGDDAAGNLYAGVSAEAGPILRLVIPPGNSNNQ